MTQNTDHTGARRRDPWRTAIWATAAFLLLLPLLAMQFSDEVAWDAGDFVVFGVLLLGAGTVYELAARRTGSVPYRSAVGVAVAAAFILLWVTGGVGIIGNEHDDANLMFFGVLAIACAGSVVARFLPAGMAGAMAVTAAAQVAVGVVALVGGFGATAPVWPLDVIGLTVFFATLWLVSAALFRKAAME